MVKHETDLIGAHFKTLYAWLVALTIVISTAWWFFVFYPTPVAPAAMHYERLIATGNTALCPGETLTYQLAVEVERAGVYSIDITVWSVNPEAPVIFSPDRHLVVTDSVGYEMNREWVVPSEIRDVLTDEQIEWAPGAYERRHAVYSLGQPSNASIAVVPFTIRSNCYDK